MTNFLSTQQDTLIHVAIKAAYFTGYCFNTEDSLDTVYENGASLAPVGPQALKWLHQAGYLKDVTEISEAKVAKVLFGLDEATFERIKADHQSPVTSDPKFNPPKAPLDSDEPVDWMVVIASFSECYSGWVFDDSFGEFLDNGGDLNKIVTKAKHCLRELSYADYHFSVSEYVISPEYVVSLIYGASTLDSQDFVEWQAAHGLILENIPHNEHVRDPEMRAEVNEAVAAGCDVAGLYAAAYDTGVAHRKSNTPSTFGFLTKMVREQLDIPAELSQTLIVSAVHVYMAGYNKA